MALTKKQRGRAVRMEIKGLDEFLAGLRKMSADVMDMRKVYELIALLARDRARAAAPSRIQRGIQKRADATGAYVDVIRRPPDAVGRVMGANRRFGWYEKSQFMESAGKQFEPWVGNQWAPGANAGKPYYIGDAINEAVDEIIELFGEDIMRKATPAYPSGGGASMTAT